MSLPRLALGVLILPQKPMCPSHVAVPSVRSEHSRLPVWHLASTHSAQVPPPGCHLIITATPRGLSSHLSVQIKKRAQRGDMSAQDRPAGEGGRLGLTACLFLCVCFDIYFYNDYFKWKYNSYTTEFTLLKCTVRWFLVYSRSCTAITTV